MNRALTPGAVWTCNGQAFAIEQISVEHRDGDRLHIDIALVPAESAELAVHTFDRWPFRRTVHIGGQAWEIVHWYQGILAANGPRWEFTLARLPDYDRLLIDVDARRRRARVFWAASIALVVAEIAASTMWPSLHHTWPRALLTLVPALTIAKAVALESWVGGYEARDRVEVQ